MYVLLKPKLPGRNMVVKRKILLLKFSEAFEGIEIFFEREDVDILLQKRSFSGVLCSGIIKLQKLKCSEAIF